MAHKEIPYQKFAEFPEPAPQEFIPDVRRDEYLRSIESLISSLSFHIRRIQEEETNTTNQFSQALSTFANKPIDKRKNREDVLRDVYQAKIQKIREKRTMFREMLLEANAERKKVLDSMQFEKVESDHLRRKLAKLGALSTGGLERETRKVATVDAFAAVLFVMELFMIVCFNIIVEFNPNTITETDVGTPYRIAPMYKFFTGIQFMAFLGFGFLLTFLRKYQYSSIGFSLFLTTLAFQWSVLVQGFWFQLSNTTFTRITLNGLAMLDGIYGAVAVLISFGVVAGVASSTQLVVMTFFEVIFYGLNIYIGTHLFGTVDPGGSIFIHTFGAYFGLGVSYWLGRNRRNNPADRDPALVAKGSTYHSDLFAMLGTVFLWVFWPSFNAALAVDKSQHRAAMNTTLALCSSVVFGFLGSRVFRGGKFEMIDIQNATLAGGVALGSVASTIISPGGSMIIGALAAVTATLGYVYATPYLEERWGVVDIRGVHNLHGMPGVLGAIAGIVASVAAWDTEGMIYGQEASELLPKGGEQAAFAFAALVVTLGIALVTGIFTGFLLTLGNLPGEAGKFYTDEVDWHVPSDFRDDTPSTTSSQNTVRR